MRMIADVDEDDYEYRNRAAAMRALAKYVRMRLRSESTSIGEHGLVWIIDADRALSALDPLDRNILLGRIYGFTMPEIAKLLHKGTSTMERRMPKAQKTLVTLFLERRVITDVAQYSREREA